MRSMSIPSYFMAMRRGFQVRCHWNQRFDSKSSCFQFLITVNYLGEVWLTNGF